jgi:hypothetical protein
LPISHGAKSEFANQTDVGNFNEIKAIMRSFFLTFLCALLIILCGCSGFFKGKAASEAAIAHFHDLFNEGKLEDIWAESSSQFQAAGKKSKYDEFMQAVQQKLGKSVSSSNVNWNIKSFNGNTTVVMVQQTKFEKGDGTESFTFQMQKENAVLLGYNIQSMDLITK